MKAIRQAPFARLCGAVSEHRERQWATRFLQPGRREAAELSIRPMSIDFFLYISRWRQQVPWINFHTKWSDRGGSI
ncbi:MAG: hypothetical protein H7835_10565 [Magnetococcus sp. XQGC-1]